MCEVTRWWRERGLRVSRGVASPCVLGQRALLSGFVLVVVGLLAPESGEQVVLFGEGRPVSDLGGSSLSGDKTREKAVGVVTEGHRGGC